ncbi:HAD family hydrolase [Pseudomonas sp. ICMP22404]|uniref:sugar phosphate nucleotidyltransferase n=1 Tax=Pseudomonas TaxID=286 RepID=UPI001119A1E7|nr:MULTISPECIES: sugar phosphate nucleotidyltransferase [Pseudomonas]MCI0992925.1 NTP transferase domain-containing protein [Pseudomonas corrugata]NUT68160.1 NTP transferase domain-containing protein [Pseudomonas corrugata]TNF81383.1 HAD family hydrolase [Pseudomonas sp. ICMP22404]
MRAYVLCGGFGTRLSAVLQGSQKAVVDIHGRPFLALVLAELKQAGMTQAVLCAHYRADQLAELLPSLMAETGLDLQIVVEEQPMGTGGAILHALRQMPPEGRFLVLNADTWLDRGAYRLAMTAPGDVLVGVEVDDRSRYGSLECAEDLQLLALKEKGLSGPGMVNAGVYAFTADALQHCVVQPCSMEQDILPMLIRRRSLKVCAYSGPFIDIGTPDALSAFKSGFEEAIQP